MASLCASSGLGQPWPALECKGFATSKRRIGSSRRGFVVNFALALDKKSYGAMTVQGTGRANMEDTVSVSIDSTGSQPSFFGVFDGHGGIAVAELLKTRLWPEYKKKLSQGGGNFAKATKSAYLEVDEMTLAQPKGLFGALQERGVGGSRCGATAATAVLMPPKDGTRVLVAANVGDARVVVSKGGKALQLTVDHKPEVESERKRIEAKNPTPKKPLVVNVGGTWRIGGLLSLSRAFGDAFLKDWSDGKPDGAGGGFGLTAEPDVTIQEISPDDKVVILGTDGLWETMAIQDAVDICLSAQENDTSPGDVAKKLVKISQERGSTDDIAVIVIFP
ncbi:probable protein phosphatase 2C 45 isoform X1 [Selaginella moellendorffii]|uniref:probable protein phosphatase 2C 45 isoform X1 n=2 Tax=Selaginella moellendorffii TaxID=88036 RepID=UPI000D1D0346|nr:probable protein phosphatase 2C 45 isoform X1 [Selaginella moellendorffii]|eukprot:XP_024516624.1 probable protein phosphatase 2C 45 isoform X1 [Selaginella moellendorffii]